MTILEHLYPRDSQRQSKISFDVAPALASHQPSVKSLGITSQLTGSRSDLIIADDIETSSNSQTQLMRDRLGEGIKEFEAILKPDTSINYLKNEHSVESFINDSLPSFSFMTWTPPRGRGEGSQNFSHKLMFQLFAFP